MGSRGLSNLLACTETNLKLKFDSMRLKIPKDRAYREIDN